MLSAISVALIGANVLLLIPVLVLLFEVATTAALRRKPERPAKSRGGLPVIAVLVPAHDEEAGIRSTLEDIVRQLPITGRLLVVADNCSDQTAEVARAAGAEVIERQDPARRGKGYALDFGCAHLCRSPPDIVVVVDADCRMSDGALNRIVCLCAATGRPIQSNYAMIAPESSTGDLRISEFAWRVNTAARSLGVSRLAFPCQLAGTGMAFPWGALTTTNLATAHLCEDLKLGLELAARGFPPLLCPSARVESRFPQSERGAFAQRQRWENGALGILLREAPRSLWRGVRTGNPALLFLALDAMVPPLVVLSAAIAAFVVLGAAAAILGGGSAPLVMALASAVLFASSLLLAYRDFGTDLLRIKDLPALIAFTLRKLRIYRSSPTAWIRTDRT